MFVRYSYLKEKFPREVADEIFNKMWADVISEGDFTLGRAVREFEQKFAELVGAKHAIGVANGTDAIKLPLKALGVGPGDEVITAANTFVASLGAIVECYATPVLVDMAPGYVLDASLIEAKITPKTKAIVPVWFTGEAPEMDEVVYVSKKHGIPIVEDACQAVLASYRGKLAGNFGAAGAFSLHPLKNLNVWGDGGVITTNDEEMYKKLKLMQNHGMKNRDEISCFGVNSRLDSLQAVVGNYLIGGTKASVQKRRENAAYFDYHLRDFVHIIERRVHAYSCFHLYMFEVDKSIRNPLLKFLQDAEIEAKVHYPIPLYQQEGLKHLGYKAGDFPVADKQSDRIITLPVDEHMTKDKMDFCIDRVKMFFEMLREKGLGM